MSRSRAYTRAMARRVIARKKRIIHLQNDYWHYRHEGELRKGKIHCGCGMCRRKTKNKGRHRLIYGNYAPSRNYKHTDKQRQLAMDQDELEWLLSPFDVIIYL